jgi:predicted nucleotidyltransferase
MNWGVFLVGSTISGFGLNKSDIDMCLVHKNHPIQDARTEAVIMLNTLKNYLINSKSKDNLFDELLYRAAILANVQYYF